MLQILLMTWKPVFRRYKFRGKSQTIKLTFMKNKELIIKILVLNCGSSSVKYQLFNMEKNEVMAKGSVDRIGSSESLFNYTQAGKEKIRDVKASVDYSAALHHILKQITEKDNGVIQSIEEIDATGHRVVHGGEYFTESTLISTDVIDKVESCISMAPLHNPANLKGIRIMRELLGDIPGVAVFDTAFHQTMPEYAYLYPLPYHLYSDKRIRRYGFHGTSHRYVAIKAAELLNKPLESCNLITCHIGNGVSITAIKNGKSVDTSMGFTPLEGLMMGTRCGDIDPAIVLYLIENENLTPQQVNNILNKQSGLLGVSGKSSDMRQVMMDIADGNKKAKNGLNIFTYRIKKYIGSYLAVLGDVDAIVFTAGIGENEPLIREQAVDNLSMFGLKLNKEKNNETRGEQAKISTANSKPDIFVIPTNEELMIARDTFNIVSASNSLKR